MSDIENELEDTEYEVRMEEYEVQLRNKYSQAERDEMAKSGEALPDGSFPIKDAEDLKSAIGLNGSGDTAKSTVRSHIKKRAAALGLSAQIPDDWRESVPAVAVRRSSWKEYEVPVIAGLSVREASEGGTDIVLSGYPTTFNDPYEVSDFLGEYRETIKPGSFSKTLNETNYIPLLQDHRGDVLASFHKGEKTMDLADDGKGVRMIAGVDVVDNSNSRNMVSAIRRGDLSKMSFAFQGVKESWNEDFTERSVEELRCFDVSVVKSPANQMTSVMIRSAAQEILGREGVALFWATQQAFTEYVNTRSLGEQAEPLFEQGVKALFLLDEELHARNIYSGRGRVFVVADLMTQLRVGKTISSQNETMLKSALEALAQADEAHKKVAAAMASGRSAITGVLGIDNNNSDTVNDKASNNAGMDTGGSNDGNVVLPNDGAGVRSVPASVLRAQREVELLKLRNRNR